MKVKRNASTTVDRQWQAFSGTNRDHFLDSAVVDHLNEGKPKGGQYQPNDDY